MLIKDKNSTVHEHQLRVHKPLCQHRQEDCPWFKANRESADRRAAHGHLINRFLLFKDATLAPCHSSAEMLNAARGKRFTYAIKT